jgi:hypothetical protein
MSCDTTNFVTKPGPVGPWRSLQEMLRASHEHGRALVDASIAQRERDGISLDNHGDWRADVDKFLVEFKQAKTREAARVALRKASKRCDKGLSPIGPYIADESIERVRLKFRALSRDAVLDMESAIAAVSADVKDDDSEPVVESKRLAALAAQVRAARPFLEKAIAGVDGLEIESGPVALWESKGEPCPAEILDAIDECHLTAAVFRCAQDFMSLSPLARRGYGSPRPSTSPSSTAASVPPASVSFGDVTAALQHATSVDTQNSKLIGVLDGTNSMSPGVLPPLPSTASATAVPESQGSTSQT